jgi:hypothetical protein
MSRASARVRADKDENLVDQFVMFRDSADVIDTSLARLNYRKSHLPPLYDTKGMASCIEQADRGFSKLSRSLRRVIEPVEEIIMQVGNYSPPSKIGPRAGSCDVCCGDEEFEKSGRVVLRRCGARSRRHILCVRCFIEWFVINGQSTCPMCRHVHFDR